MSLVTYDVSDDSSEEDNASEEALPTTSNKESLPTVSTTSDSSSDLSVSKLLLSRLPAPKSRSDQPSTSYQNSSLNDLKVEKSSSGPIKIFMPSLKHYVEEDDEEEERRTKRFKGSQTGTGLKSLLPEPKNSRIKPTTTSSFIPQSLIRPKVSSLTTKRPQSTPQREESSEEKFNYFFNDEEELKNDNLVTNNVVDNDLEYGPKPVNDVEPVLETSYSYNIEEGSAVQPSLDDISYKKLIASKFGEEAPDEINIVDVDVSKHLSESKDWLKTISEEKEEVYEGVEPSSTARRKHQITYLAMQAKAREVQLKNEWSRSRVTKTMSRAKYGF